MRGWPRTLAWTDFQEIANPGPGQLVALNGNPIVARVAISIMFHQNGCSTLREGDQARFHHVDVRVQLNRSLMQYVPSRIPGGRNDYYLQHEQGHMNLMGLFGRELEVNLMALRAPTSSELLREANSTTDDAVRNARMYAINTPGVDCLYDRETNHGQNRGAQRRWNQVIASNIARWRAPDFMFRN